MSEGASKALRLLGQGLKGTADSFLWMSSLPLSERARGALLLLASRARGVGEDAELLAVVLEDEERERR